MAQESKCKLVVFSDIHYAPEKTVNNGSIIDRKLKVEVKEKHLKLKIGE